MPSVLLVFGILGASAILSTAHAQDVRETATFVSKRASIAFAALENHDWRTVAEMTDPVERVRFQHRQIAHLVSWAEAMNTQAGQRWAGHAVADSVDADRLVAQGGVPVEVFPGRPTIDTLARLTSVEFLSRFLSAIHRNWTEIRRSRMDASVAATNRQGQAVHRTVIGAVIDGDTLAHVVYYREGADFERNTLNLAVISLHRSTDEWLLLMNDDVEDSQRLLMLLTKPRLATTPR